MRRIILIAGAAFAMTLATGPARASDLDGNLLLRFCEAGGGPNRSDHPAYAVCLGYVLGIADLTGIFTKRNVTLIDGDGGEWTQASTGARPRAPPTIRWST